ncbi:MAG: hypothetical protein ABI594_02480 [Ginsengibacter sp.]
MFTHCISASFPAKWMHLFSFTHGHDLVYNCFNVLKEDKMDIIDYCHDSHREI